MHERTQGYIRGGGSEAELRGCWVLLQCGIDPWTSGRMDCDVIDVARRISQRQLLLPCAWKSLITVACLVFSFLLWPTLFTCSGRASVTATVDSIYLMALIHLLWWNTSFYDTRMNDAIITIMMYTVIWKVVKTIFKGVTKSGVYFAQIHLYTTPLQRMYSEGVFLENYTPCIPPK